MEMIPTMISRASRQGDSRLPLDGGRSDAKSCPQELFLGRLHGPEITYARLTFLFLVRHFSWMSLDVSHSQPTLHCELSVPQNGPYNEADSRHSRAIVEDK